MRNGRLTAFLLCIISIHFLSCSPDKKKDHDLWNRASAYLTASITMEPDIEIEYQNRKYPNYNAPEEVDFSNFVFPVGDSDILLKSGEFMQHSPLRLYEVSLGEVSHQEHGTIVSVYEVAAAGSSTCQKILYFFSKRRRPLTLTHTLSSSCKGESALEFRRDSITLRANTGLMSDANCCPSFLDELQIRYTQNETVEIIGWDRKPSGQSQGF